MNTVLVKRGEGMLAWRVTADDVEGLHWAGWSGGNQHWLDHPTLSGYVLCTTIPDGLQEEAGHSCTHGPPPHRIKVLVVKRKRDLAAYNLLRNRVRPRRRRAA